MSIFVLVHGGHHGGWCYQAVARRLMRAGHIVYAPSLTGLGEREHLLHPGVNLDTHITDIASLLEVEDLRGAILVGHSYGGMVITGAADRAANRTGHRVYLDAAYPVDGQSLLDHAPHQIGPLRQRMRVMDGAELVGFAGQLPPQAFGITEPGMAAWAAARLRAHP